MEDIPPGELRRVEIEGVALCIAHVEGEGFFAIDDTCTHEEIELSDGDLQGFEVECPAHGSRFNVTTGDVRGLPAREPVRVYPVQVVAGEVAVEL